MGLLELGPECEDGEVWYDIVTRVLPSERKSELIPAESDLCAIRNANGRTGVETGPETVQRHPAKGPEG